MSRELKTSAIVSDIKDAPSDAVILTPHPAAARRLGVPHLSLRRYAAQTIYARGYRIAPPLLALSTLKSVVSDAAPNQDPSALTARIREILETVLRTGIDAEALKAHGSMQVRQLAEIAAEYQFRLRRQGMFDRTEAIWQAAHLEPKREKLFVYGYFRARKEEVFFLDAAADGESVYFLPCDEHPMFHVNQDWARWLEARGWSIVNEESRAAESPGEACAKRFLAAVPSEDELRDVSALSYPDLESEVRGALAEVKRLILAGTNAGEIALVCRDMHTYGPVIAPVAEEYNLPVEIRYPVPVIDTNFGSFLRLLLDSVKNGFEFESTMRLVMHPVGQDLPEGALRQALKSHPSDVEAWTAVGVNLSCLSWPVEQSRGEWIACLKKCLSNLNVRRKAGQRAREILACDHLINELDEANFELAEPLTREQFIDEIFEIISSIVVPFSPARGGIELHQPNTIIGGRFKHLIVLGMAEGMLPAQPVENPVLDFHERKKLVPFGIDFEDAAEVPRWEALSFYFLLLTGTESLRFSYPQYVDDSEKIKNSFFRKLGLTPTPGANGEAGVISSIEEQRGVYLRHTRETSDDVLSAALLRYKVEQRRESPEDWDEHDGIVGVPIDPEARAWSASQLTSLGQCGFKWFAKYVLRLQAAEEMEQQLSPAKRGSLYHKALEIAVNKAIDADDIRDATLRYLDDAFEQAEKDPKVALPVLPNWNRQRLEHLITLRAAVSSPDFIKSNAKVLGAEQEFRTEWRGLQMRGCIDRLDETEDGIFAVDYKTSSKVPDGVKNEAGVAKIDLQLPIYLNVAIPSLDCAQGKPVAGGAYFSLTKAKELRRVAAKPQPELDNFIEKVKETLRSGTYAVEPDVDQKACTYCDYDIVCRNGNRIKRKGQMNK